MTGRPLRFFRSPGNRGVYPISLLFFFVIVLGWGPAVAVEWSMTPSVNLKEELNDNIRMTPGKRELVWGNTLSPMLRVGGATERLALRADLAANLSRYRGIEGLGSNDSSFRLSSQYQHREQSRWGWEGSLLRDSTFRSELRETGRVLAERRRSARTIGGFWEESPAERLSIRGEYRLTGVRYAEEGAGLFDYQTRTGSVDLTHLFSERDWATVGLTLLHYRAPSARIRSINAALQAGFTHLFSETLRLTVSVGGREVITDLSLPGGEITERSRGLLGDLTIHKEFEATRWQGGARRRIDPSGSGYLLQVDHLFTTMERRIAPTATVSLAANAYHGRALRTNLPGGESRSFSVAPAWRWKWTEEWSMEVSYRYAWQKRDGGVAATSNALTWTVTYLGPKWTGGIEGMSAE
ncbi:MAG: hypothetical protein WBK96_15920 [Candidatus Manganitrophaceae bacterium]